MSDKVNFFVPDLSSPAIVANKSGGREGVHQHLHQPRHRAKLLFVFAQRETTYHIILGADLVGVRAVTDDSLGIHRMPFI